MEERITDQVTPHPTPDGHGDLVPAWKPVLAALLSLVFAGIGHLFVRAYLRAFAFFVPNWFLYTISGYWPNGVLLNIVCFIVAAFDAYSLAKNGRGIL